MKRLSLIAAALTFCLCAACVQKTPLSISVTNRATFDRNGEMVEVSMEDINARLHLADTAQFIIIDENDQQVPYQITYDGLVAFPANVKASATSTYTIKEGVPDDFETCAYGKVYPERLDDVAWENDRVAFRTYGPALQKSGERAFGYDVWCKRTSDLVVEDRYAKELDSVSRMRVDSLNAIDPQRSKEFLKSISYHVDHGNGMDAYSVGPTLGAGTAALIDGESIAYPKCYKTCEILDNGPLRFTVKLTYEPIVFKGDSNIIETRIISLDKGSQLNKTIVYYSGLKKKADLCVGIVIHPSNPTAYVMNKEMGYIGYEDLTDNANNDNGKIYLGAVFPIAVKETKAILFTEKESKELRGGATGHVLAVSDYLPQSEYLYYWGDGWSKWGFPSKEIWEKYLQHFSIAVRNPLVVTLN